MGLHSFVLGGTYTKYGWFDYFHYGTVNYEKLVKENRIKHSSFTIKDERKRAKSELLIKIGMTKTGCTQH